MRTKLPIEEKLAEKMREILESTGTIDVFEDLVQFVKSNQEEINEFWWEVAELELNFNTMYEIGEDKETDVRRLYYICDRWNVASRINWIRQLPEHY